MNSYSRYSPYSIVLEGFRLPSVSLNLRILNTTNTDYIRSIRCIRELGENIEKTTKTVFAVFSIRGFGEDNALQIPTNRSEYSEYAEYRQLRHQPHKNTVYSCFYCEQCSKQFVAPEDETLNAAKCWRCGKLGQRVYSESEFERKWGWTHAIYTGGKHGRWIPTGTPEEQERRRKRFPRFFK